MSNPLLHRAMNPAEMLSSLRLLPGKDVVAIHEKLWVLKQHFPGNQYIWNHEGGSKAHRLSLLKMQRSSRNGTENSLDSLVHSKMPSHPHKQANPEMRKSLDQRDRRATRDPQNNHEKPQRRKDKSAGSREVIAQQRQQSLSLVDGKEITDLKRSIEVTNNLDTVRDRTITEKSLGPPKKQIHGVKTGFQRKKRKQGVPRLRPIGGWPLKYYRSEGNIGT